jgi:hypothetical protein
MDTVSPSDALRVCIVAAPSVGDLRYRDGKAVSITVSARPAVRVTHEGSDHACVRACVVRRAERRLLSGADAFLDDG